MSAAADGGFTPQDEQVREAIRAHVDENMCVEAGAGTGKTTVLVERIAHILRTTDTRADELAVITFTEKAAAELASRVRSELERARDAGDETERARIEAALRDLNRAHVETIHAFAAGLLRERPVEAGLDPGFIVLDEMPSQMAFEAAWTEWINGQMAEDPPPQALVDALEMNLEFPRFRDAADKLNRHRNLLPLGKFEMPAIDARRFLDELEEQADVLRNMHPRMKHEDDAAFANIGTFVRWADEILALRGHEEETLVRAVTNSQAKPLKRRTGARANWVVASECDKTKDAEAKIPALIDGYRKLLRQAATANLLHWLEGFVAYYAEVRRARGEADFDDLLIWARDLVRDSDEVRRYFGEKYKRILVDEFQDTDPLQVEMIVRMCAEDDPGADWRSATLRPGSLFVVGDPKQSIYRFRRADIGMYDDVKRGLFGEVTQEITQNFRSVKPIIDWVNATFDRIMQRKAGVQPEHIALQHDPRQPGRDGAVTFIDGDVSGTVPEMRRAEADAIAALIERSVRDGAWMVRDRTTGEERRAGRGDIAVLIPSRTELYLYEQAFARAEMPYRHEGGRTFFARQEIRELVAILRAIDDPSDGVATVAALRSSAFGCSDEDLFAYREQAGFAQAHVPADATGAVAGALRTLRSFTRERHTSPLPELIRDVLGATRLVEFAMLQPQGDQVAANLLKVIDQARAFVDARGGGLRAFVRWLKTNITQASDLRYGAAPESEAAISEESDDVVRILTIHAAKGLEFPVVVLANMESARQSYTTVIPSHRAGGPSLEMRIGNKDQGFQTPGFDDAERVEAEHDRAEDQRLLYVATTRARDRIIVPLITGAAPKNGNAANRPALNALIREGGIADIGARIDAAELERVGEELPVWRRAPSGAPDDEVRRVIESREAWSVARALTLDIGNAPLLVRTATSLKGDHEAPVSQEGGIRRAKAAEFGTAVHALLERIDLRQPEDAPAMAEAVAREHSLIGREREIADVAERALGSEIVARALRSRRLLREAPFTAPLPADGLPGLAEGRIDLLFEEDGGLVIVDFKTDRVTAAEARARIAGDYRTQALVYAWAAKQATGMEVREVVFLFARPEPALECAIAVDAAFMAEAEALMREPIAAAV
jgi:ATP-dependent exoDNAse (exonuclease V) beta subunit